MHLKFLLYFSMKSRLFFFYDFAKFTLKPRLTDDFAQAGEFAHLNRVAFKLR